jgi:hypothetical protein
MEEIIRYLAYPAIEVGMFAARIGSGFGIEIFVVLIFIGCILACINEFKLSKFNILSVAPTHAFRLLVWCFIFVYFKCWCW